MLALVEYNMRWCKQSNNAVYNAPNYQQFISSIRKIYTIIINNFTIKNRPAIIITKDVKIQGNKDKTEKRAI